MSGRFRSPYAAPTATEAGKLPREISWWPAGLGTPAAAGGQNAMRYAFFPATKRLVIDDNGAVSVYDTGDHYFNWRLAATECKNQTLSFSSSDGPVALASLNAFPRSFAIGHNLTTRTSAMTLIYMPSSPSSILGCKILVPSTAFRNSQDNILSIDLQRCRSRPQPRLRCCHALRLGCG